MTTRRRRSAGGRVAVVLLVLVVLLLGALVVGDRWAEAQAEERAAQRLQTELGTPTQPSVEIEGLPFLTQLAAQRLSSVHVVADDVSPPDQPGTSMQHVDLRLHGLTSPDRLQTFAAERVEGTASIDYATAKALTGQALTYARDGRVELSNQTELLGLNVTAKVQGRPAVNQEDQTLTLDEPSVTVAGVEVPDVTSQALLDTLAKPAPIKGVPYGLQVTSITAEPDRLVVGLVGKDVTFSR